MKKWTTQAGGVASPTALHLRQNHKEANTRLVVSQLAVRQFHQMNMMLQYIHMEGEIFSTKGVRRGEMRMRIGRTLVKRTPLNG